MAWLSLPLNDILDGMPFLRTNLPQDPPEAEDLLAYFDRTYVSGQYRPIRQQEAKDVAGFQPLRMRHVAPTFPPTIWNVN